MTHEFSTVDGFVEISECLAEMIKFVANEPSVGLFYVQRHTQNAVPNVINLRNNVLGESRETNLHTEDLEDSITVVRSMQECGFPIADDMIRDIRKSLAIMSTQQPKRGLIHNPTSGLTGRTSSWGPATWQHNGAHAQQRTSSYFSTVFKSAKEKASNFKWRQLDLKESTAIQKEKLPSYPDPLHSVGSASTSPTIPELEADEPPLSSQAADEPEADARNEQVDVNSPADDLLPQSENFEEFKANKEAELEEWLGGTADNHNNQTGPAGITGGPEDMLVRFHNKTG